MRARTRDRYVYVEREGVKVFYEVFLAIYLPEMAISLVLVLLLEKAVFSRVPAVSRWLGLAQA